jgi:hypothetical protein
MAWQLRMRRKAAMCAKRGTTIYASRAHAFVVHRREMRGKLLEMIARSRKSGRIDERHKITDLE